MEENGRIINVTFKAGVENLSKVENDVNKTKQKLESENITLNTNINLKKIEDQINKVTSSFNGMSRSVEGAWKDVTIKPKLDDKGFKSFEQSAVNIEQWLLKINNRTKETTEEVSKAIQKLTEGFEPLVGVIDKIQKEDGTFEFEIKGVKETTIALSSLVGTLKDVQKNVSALADKEGVKNLRSSVEIEDDIKRNQDALKDYKEALKNFSKTKFKDPADEYFKSKSAKKIVNELMNGGGTDIKGLQKFAGQLASAFSEGADNASTKVVDLGENVTRTYGQIASMIAKVAKDNEGFKFDNKGALIGYVEATENIQKFEQELMSAQEIANRGFNVSIDQKSLDNLSKTINEFASVVNIGEDATIGFKSEDMRQILDSFKSIENCLLGIVEIVNSFDIKRLDADKIPELPKDLSNIRDAIKNVKDETTQTTAALTDATEQAEKLTSALGETPTTPLEQTRESIEETGDALYDAYVKMRQFQDTIDKNSGTDIAKQARAAQEEIAKANPQLSSFLDKWERLNKEEFSARFNKPAEEIHETTTETGKLDSGLGEATDGAEHLEETLRNISNISFDKLLSAIKDICRTSRQFELSDKGNWDKNQYGENYARERKVIADMVGEENIKDIIPAELTDSLDITQAQNIAGKLADKLGIVRESLSMKKTPLVDTKEITVEEEKVNKLVESIEYLERIKDKLLRQGIPETKDQEYDGELGSMTQLENIKEVIKDLKSQKIKLNCDDEPIKDALKELEELYKDLSDFLDLHNFNADMSLEEKINTLCVNGKRDLKSLSDTYGSIELEFKDGSVKKFDDIGWDNHFDPKAITKYIKSIKSEIADVRAIGGMSHKYEYEDTVGDNYEATRQNFEYEEWKNLQELVPLVDGVVAHIQSKVEELAKINPRFKFLNEDFITRELNTEYANAYDEAEKTLKEHFSKAGIDLENVFNTFNFSNTDWKYGSDGFNRAVQEYMDGSITLQQAADKIAESYGIIYEIPKPFTKAVAKKRTEEPTSTEKLDSEIQQTTEDTQKLNSELSATSTPSSTIESVEKLDTEVQQTTEDAKELNNTLADEATRLNNAPLEERLALLKDMRTAASMWHKESQKDNGGEWLDKVQSAIEVNGKLYDSLEDCYAKYKVIVDYADGTQGVFDMPMVSGTDYDMFASNEQFREQIDLRKKIKNITFETMSAEQIAQQQEEKWNKQKEAEQQTRVQRSKVKPETKASIEDYVNAPSDESLKKAWASVKSQYGSIIAQAFYDNLRTDMQGLLSKDQVRQIQQMGSETIISALENFAVDNGVGKLFSEDLLNEAASLDDLHYLTDNGITEDTFEGTNTALEKEITRLQKYNKQLQDQRTKIRDEFEEVINADQIDAIEEEFNENLRDAYEEINEKYGVTEKNKSEFANNIDYLNDRNKARDEALYEKAKQYYEMAQEAYDNRKEEIATDKANGDYEDIEDYSHYYAEMANAYNKAQDVISQIKDKSVREGALSEFGTLYGSDDTKVKIKLAQDALSVYVEEWENGTARIQEAINETVAKIEKLKQITVDPTWFAPPENTTEDTTTSTNQTNEALKEADNTTSEMVSHTNEVTDATEKLNEEVRQAEENYGKAAQALDDWNVKWQAYEEKRVKYEDDYRQNHLYLTDSDAVRQTDTAFRELFSEFQRMTDATGKLKKNDAKSLYDQLLNVLSLHYKDTDTLSRDNLNLPYTAHSSGEFSIYKSFDEFMKNFRSMKWLKEMMNGYDSNDNKVSYSGKEAYDYFRDILSEIRSALSTAKDMDSNYKTHTNDKEYKALKAEQTQLQADYDAATKAQREAWDKQAEAQRKVEQTAEQVGQTEHTQTERATEDAKEYTSTLEEVNAQMNALVDKKQALIDARSFLQDAKDNDFIVPKDNNNARYKQDTAQVLSRKAQRYLPGFDTSEIKDLENNYDIPLTKFNNRITDIFSKIHTYIDGIAGDSGVTIESISEQIYGIEVEFSKLQKQHTALLEAKKTPDWTKDLDPKQIEAVNAYLEIMKKRLGDSYNEARNLKAALELVADIKAGNIESLMGRFHNGNPASNKALGIMTGLPTNNQENRDSALRSLNEQAYDDIIAAQEAERKMQEEAESFSGKWKAFSEAIIGTNIWEKDSPMDRGKVAKAFEQYGETAKDGLDYINKLWLSGQANVDDYEGPVKTYINLLNDEAEMMEELKIVKVGDLNVESLFGGGNPEHYTEETVQEAQQTAAEYDKLIAKKKEMYGITSAKPVEEQEEMQQEVKKTTLSHQELIDTLKEMEDIYGKIERNQFTGSNFPDYVGQYDNSIIDTSDINDANSSVTNIENIKSKLLETYKTYKNIQNAINNNNGWFKGQQYTERDLENLQELFKSLAYAYHNLSTEHNNFEDRMKEEAGVTPEYVEDLTSVTGKMTKQFKECAAEVIADKNNEEALNQKYKEETERLQEVNKELTERYKLLRTKVISSVTDINAKSDMSDVLPYLSEDEDYTFMENWGDASFGHRMKNPTVLAESEELLGFKEQEKVAQDNLQEKIKQTEQTSTESANTQVANVERVAEAVEQTNTALSKEEKLASNLESALEVILEQYQDIYRAARERYETKGDTLYKWNDPGSWENDFDGTIDEMLWDKFQISGDKSMQNLKNDFREFIGDVIKDARKGSEEAFAILEKLTSNIFQSDIESVGITNTLNDRILNSYNSISSNHNSDRASSDSIFKYIQNWMFDHKIQNGIQDKIKFGIFSNAGYKEAFVKAFNLDVHPDMKGWNKYFNELVTKAKAGEQDAIEELISIGQNQTDTLYDITTSQQREFLDKLIKENPTNFESNYDAYYSMFGSFVESYERESGNILTAIFDAWTKDIPEFKERGEEFKRSVQNYLMSILSDIANYDDNFEEFNVKEVLNRLFPLVKTKLGYDTPVTTPSTESADQINSRLEAARKLSAAENESYKDVVKLNSALEEQAKINYSPAGADAEMLTAQERAQEEIQATKQETETATAEEKNDFEKLSESINGVTESVLKKTEAIKEERDYVSGAVQGEVNDFTTLDGMIYNVILTVEKLADSIKNLPPIDLSNAVTFKDLTPETVGIAAVTAVQEQIDAALQKINALAKVIGELKTIEIKVKGENLDTKALSDIAKATQNYNSTGLQGMADALNSFNIKNGMGAKLTEMAQGIKDLREASKGGSIALFDQIGKILTQGEELKAFAEIIKKSKTEIGNAAKGAGVGTDGTSLASANIAQYRDEMEKLALTLVDAKKGEEGLAVAYQAMAGGLTRVTAFTKDANNVYRKYVFDTEKGQDIRKLDVTNDQSKLFNDIRRWERYEKMIAAFTGKNNIYQGNVDFTRDSAQWEDLINLANQFGVSLDNIAKITRKVVDKNGELKESFTFTDFQGGTKTFGASSNHILMQNDTVVDGQKALQDYMGLLPKYRTACVNAAKGDETAKLKAKEYREELEKLQATLTDLNQLRFTFDENGVINGTYKLISDEDYDKAMAMRKANGREIGKSVQGFRDTNDANAEKEALQAEKEREKVLQEEQKIRRAIDAENQKAADKEATEQQKYQDKLNAEQEAYNKEQENARIASKQDYMNWWTDSTNNREVTGYENAEKAIESLKDAQNKLALLQSKNDGTAKMTLQINNQKKAVEELKQKATDAYNALAVDADQTDERFKKLTQDLNDFSADGFKDFDTQKVINANNTDTLMAQRAKDQAAADKEAEQRKQIQQKRDMEMYEAENKAAKEQANIQQKRDVETAEARVKAYQDTEKALNNLKEAQNKLATMQADQARNYDTSATTANAIQEQINSIEKLKTTAQEAYTALSSMADNTDAKFVALGEDLAKFSTNGFRDVATQNAINAKDKDVNEIRAQQQALIQQKRDKETYDAQVKDVDTWNKSANNAYKELTSKAKEYYSLLEREKSNTATPLELTRLTELKKKWEDATNAVGDYEIKSGGSANTTNSANKSQANFNNTRNTYFSGILKELNGFDAKANKVLNQAGKYTQEFATKVTDAQTNIKQLQSDIRNTDLSQMSDNELDSLLQRIVEIRENASKMFASTNLSNKDNLTAKVLTIAKLRQHIAEVLNDNSAMSKELHDKFLQLQKDAKNFGNGSAAASQELITNFAKLNAELEESGQTGKNLFGRITDSLTTANAQILSQYFSWQDWINYAREAFTTINELDTALVDLRKTANMSTDELNGFYYSANDIAKQMGVTTTEIINQAAAWSRLGYSTADEAETMAALSSQFASISPGMDTDTAQETLVSAMKGFGIGTEDVERKIMDNVNRIGNTMALSNSDVMDMLERSSAAMSAANNSIEQTIALESAAMEITQNAESTGTAFRTKICTYVQKCA